jgi:hypothetical protein
VSDYPEYTYAADCGQAIISELAKLQHHYGQIIEGES